jgi:hypothetical protein
VPESRTERQLRRDDAYRAIGRYIVAFSRLIAEMRTLMADYIGTRGHGGSIIVEELLGDVGPKNIADAYFGMLRRYGDLNDAELKMESALRTRIVKGTEKMASVIQTRADIAHGDWWIGLMRRGSSGELIELDASLVRIKASRSAGPAAVPRDLRTDQINEMADELVDLTNTIVDFGRLALKMPMIRQDDSSADPTNSVGEFRVSDIYTLEGGNKSAGKARLVRNGTSAHLLPFMPWAWKD